MPDVAPVTSAYFIMSRFRVCQYLVVIPACRGPENEKGGPWRPPSYRLTGSELQIAVEDLMPRQPLFVELLHEGVGVELLDVPYAPDDATDP